MTTKQWIKSPKGYVTITMIAYLLIASLGTHSWQGIYSGIIAAGTAMILDVLISLLRRKERKEFRMPDSAVITGLIIALILNANTPGPIVAATAALAILSKHLFVHKKKPIFNPAAAGLLLSIPIFQTGQSWWGAFGDMPAWTVLFLLIGGYAVTNRVSKYPQIFAFFAAFFAILLAMGYYQIGDAVDALRPPFINAALFFGFFMLTDPPTSPAKTKGQVAFGILTAVIGNAIYGLFGGLTYLFIGLLLANFYHYLRSRRTSAQQVKARPQPQRSPSLH